MKTLRHLTPALRVYSGADSLRQLSAELKRCGVGRAVVFCGETIAHHPDGLRLVAEAVGDRLAGVFDRVKAHSPLSAVLGGAERLRALNADGVIPIGGGSAVVTARAASIVLAEGRAVTDLCTQFPSGQPPISPRLDKPKLPQFIVPTTPTTAYAKAGSAVFDESSSQRLALFDPKTRATALFVHPTLALTAPRALTMTAAVGALSVAVQAMESRVRDPLADALLLQSLHLLATNLRKLDRMTQDADTRLQLMLGALLAGQGSDYAPTGLASALAHAIGARVHLDHGVSNAIVLPHAMRFNATEVGDRLQLIAYAIEGCTPTSPEPKAVEVVERLFSDLALPRRLRDVGVTSDLLASIAESTLGDWFLHQNPRVVSTKADVLEVLRAAW